MERRHQAVLSPAGQIPLGFKEDFLRPDALSFGLMVVAVLAPGLSLSLCVLPPCPQLHLWSHSSFFLMGIPCYSQVVLSVHFLLVESQEFNSLPSLLPGEGNDNPLQYSCLENPVDGGAWWAAVYGVTKSWTRLK